MTLQTAFHASYIHQKLTIQLIEYSATQSQGKAGLLLFVSLRDVLRTHGRVDRHILAHDRRSGVAQRITAGDMDEIAGGQRDAAVQAADDAALRGGVGFGVALLFLT